MLRFLFAIVALLLTTVSAQDFDTFRLPNNTRPETYDVSLRTWIDEGNGTFTGSVRIGIVAVESTDFIRLHHQIQQVENVRVLSADQTPITIGTPSYNGQYSFLTIPINGANLTQGTRYFVEMDFAGSMNSYSGFYRSSFLIDGELRQFASTQFEPTYARNAFPCYDELQIKANFTIRLTHGSTYAAISNMPVVSVTPNSDGSATTLFETSPPMSTYLVAFHVSDFPHVTSSPPRSVPQRIFARANALNDTGFALNAGELLLEAIADYVDIDYNLPKMDQIAVPGFPSGAMENWGLVTYAEFYALYDNTTDLYTRRVYGTQTISHELAHQWFGNLVTPRWWTYLWMKEGFATFFEYLGSELVYPEWRMMDYSVIDNNQYVMRIDSNEFTLPMTHYVEHPIDIDFHFDAIAYQKAAAVLRMFWHIFGEETFMNGVIAYLKTNMFSDAVEEDLFDAIAIYVWADPNIVLPPGGNVSTIMSSWTRQSGFPLITVERNYDTQVNQVTFTQARYYSYPPVNPENQTWWVPYSFATPDNPGFENTRAEGWIPNTPTFVTTVNNLDADDYFLINNQAAGYYRVLYDDRNYRLISDAIVRNTSLFHSTDVSQLIDDAFEFYEHGHIHISVALDLLRVLEFRSDAISWSSAFNFIFFINRNFQGHRNFPLWSEFVRTLTEELYDAIRVNDIEDEPILDKSARENIVHLACMMGSVHCRSDATRQLRQQLEIGEDFHPNVRGVMRCASMRSATRNDVQAMWGIFRGLEPDNFVQRFEIIDMMACVTSRPLLNEFVRTAYDLTIYTEFEQYTVINAVLQNGGNLGISVTLEFFIDNAVQTIEIFGSWFVQNLAYYISNAEHIERFTVFQNVILDAGLMTQEEADFNLYLIEQSSRWLENEGEEISEWLEENFA